MGQNPNNPLRVSIDFADKHEQKTISVVNAAPRISTIPTISFSTDEEGRKIATLSARFEDEGALDEFKASVTWGDKVNTTGIADRETHTISASRVITSESIS